MDKEYDEARKYFGVSASNLVFELPVYFEGHQEGQCSSAKLAEVIMVFLYKSKPDEEGKIK